jgi:hypothetical protein
MVKGIFLTLLIGPAVPISAPREVMDAITQVQVTQGPQRSGFQLTFAISKDSLLLTTLLPAGYFDPMVTRVVVIVTLNGFPHVLMDGLVTRQEMTPSSEPGQSTLTITGEDLSIAMDIVQVARSFPAMPKVAQIYAALAPYLALGIVPIVIPPFINTVDSPTARHDSQLHVTDREYIRRLANMVGYVFYLEPGPMPLSSIAYFGPDIRLPVPQPALSINMDGSTNVESLSFTLDGLAKKILVATITVPGVDRFTFPVPVPNINVFKPPLGARPTPPARVEFTNDLAGLAPDAATEKIIGKLMSSTDAISAQGTLDVLRYGHVLRSRMLVGVRGVGLAYDGMYYVNNVTHTLKRSEYKQSFNLSRDGLISNTPKVMI